MKAELKNILDINNYDIQEIRERIFETACKKYEEQILIDSNTTKSEIISEQSIIEGIKALQLFNKKQVILLNISLKGWFKKIMIGNNILQNQSVCTLMGIDVIMYPYEKFNFYIIGLLEKYDEIILIIKETEFYIIDSKKFLEFINK